MNFFNKLFHWYFSKNALPYWCVLTLDCMIIFLSELVCFWISDGGNAIASQFWKLTGTLLFYMVFFLIGFRIMKTYRGVLRYSSFTDIVRIGTANLIGVGFIAIARMFFHFDHYFVPIRYRELIMIFLIATFLMWCMRIIVKSAFDSMHDEGARKAFIYGVKTGGIGLAKAINSEQPKRFIIKGFISDAKDMDNKFLLGVPVYTNNVDIVEKMKRKGANSLIVAMYKQDTFINDTEMVDMMIDNNISIFVMNPATPWDNNSDIKVSQLHEIDVEDLLPREQIKINLQSVEELINGKSVLITGAAGSIGSEMAKQIAEFKPSRLTLVDQAETPCHDIRLTMKREHPEINVATIVTSICKKSRMEKIFAECKPDYVFHAAAYKHVPMMEDNPCESIQNNIGGTKVVADLSVKYGVKKFVMISTDKAVNPTNVMGCSKRICEIYVQSLDDAIKKGKVNGITQFVTTRFGNVLGSNGSVIPLFKEQIRKGGPVTVTDPNIIRYFMLIPEACKLVLEAGTMGKGGEIFVFDMGKPVKIANLAKRMIALSGAKDVKIEYTGLRDGEKLYEEVLTPDEETLPTFNEKIKIAKVRIYDYEDVKKTIETMIEDSIVYDDMKTVREMKDLVPEYKSQHSKYEALD